MNPVIGLDVAKGVSVAQAFLERGKPFGKAKKIKHSQEGFQSLHSLLTEMMKITGVEPSVVLEATGHYHRSVVAFLEREGHKVIIINPLQAKRARGAQLRKVKTDEADAWQLAELFFREELKPGRKWESDFVELQHLTRQHEFLTGLYVQAKLNATSLLDQVFPEFTEVFYRVFSKSGLNVLLNCLQAVPENVEEIRDWIAEVSGKSHSNEWIVQKSDLIEKAIIRNEFEEKSRAQILSLRSMVSLLIQFQEQLDLMEEEIEAAVASFHEAELLKTIPGIGNRLAAAILAELGDAKQFNSPKQLVAFAGLDPGVFSSGKFVATHTRITKRGSKRLRRAIYLAVQCGIRGKNERIKEYYHRKRNEGKPHKVALIACSNKLLHHIYAVITKKEAYKAQ